jgi:DNA polymerase III delta prime subunit
MIPEFFDDENTPPGEQDFFGWLAACPSDWLVLHSLDLQAWNRNRQTEVDFVVIIPDTGVCCIEVKSHERVEVTPSGAWKLNGEIKKRSPLKQAEDASKVLQRRISNYHPELNHVPVCRLVAFPRASFPLPRSVEYHPWEILDATRCLKYVGTGDFGSAIAESLCRSVNQSPFVRQLPSSLTTKCISKIRDLLRPAFKSHPSSKTENIRRRAQTESLLRTQQKPVLNLFRNNDRLIVDGPAGTGKTLIALELARQAVEAGKRTGLICFNRLIGEHLASKTAIDGPLLVAGSVSALLARLLDIEIPENASQEFWDGEFLDQAESLLLSDERVADCPFDVLIIDESQDLLCRPRLLNCVEFLLRGAFKKGRWALFGDFQNQVLANDEQRENASARLKELKGFDRTAFYQLDENCRNYAIVGKPGLCLAGMDNVYSEYRRGDGTQEAYSPQFFLDKKSFDAKLKAEIKRYVDAGTALSDIVVLSCTGRSNSIAADLVGDGKLLKRYGVLGDQANFASVYEFKGLESSVVILTDIAEPKSDLERDAFYVGMTRATYAVSIFVPQNIHRWFAAASMRLLS